MLPPHYAILAAAVQEQMNDNLYLTQDLPPHATGPQGAAFRAIGRYPPPRFTHGTEEMVERGCVCTACRQTREDGV